jgi:hypothetical protein
MNFATFPVAGFDRVAICDVSPRAGQASDVVDIGKQVGGPGLGKSAPDS